VPNRKKFLKKEERERRSAVPRELASEGGEGEKGEDSRKKKEKFT